MYCIEFLYIATARFLIKIHRFNTWEMFHVCYLQICLLYTALICQISTKERYDQLFPFEYTQPYIARTSTKTHKTYSVSIFGRQRGADKLKGHEKSQT